MSAVAGVLGTALVLGIVVPWVFVRMLTPSLAASERARAVNFRGRELFYGLGIVWLVWAGCAIVGGVAPSVLTGDGASQSILPILTLAGPLALVAFALGVIDDAYGDASARGFKGHIKAMLRGRLTTGGLKLIGIGLASLVVAWIVGDVAPWGYAGESLPQGPLHPVLVVAAGAAIALTSNFVNLTDLRPGRALKAYGLLACLGVVSVCLGLAGGAWGSAMGITSPQIALQAAALLMFLIGPVVAVWRYDLGELGMLGDAGANPMGAVTGLFIVAGMPAWGLVAYLALMLALNAASERFSYSRVIESTPALKWVDSLGRIPVEVDSAKSSGQSDGNPE